MKFAVAILVSAFSLFLPFSAFSAEWTPLQVSLVYPIQVFPKETKVQGLRLNLLYGVNDAMSGIDLGLVNRTTGTTQGLQLGAFPYGGINITERLDGLQFAGFFGGVNIAGQDVSGLQLAGMFAGVNFAKGAMNGVQIAGILGGINMAGNLQGMQIAAFFIGANIARNTTGIQLATLYNQADEMKGLQVGLVNVCNRMTGVQIGLANIIKEGRLPFFPVVNASF